MTTETQERDKYAEIWQSVPEYRDYSPGLENVERFMSVVKPELGETLIDIGCGTGCAGLQFKERGLDCWWLDITDAALDSVIDRHRFIQKAVWDRWRTFPAGWDYGFCCDVLEHIPTEYTMLVIDRILWSCSTAWFQINFLPDVFGQLIGQTLHLTVRPFTWWKERLESMGEIIEARDLHESGLFVVQR